MPLHQFLVVSADQSDEDTRMAAGEIPQHQSSVLQRLPGHLEQQTLLRIHVCCFSWRDAEEARVEVGDGIEEPTPPCDDLAWLAWCWVEVGVDIKAVLGDLRERVTAFEEQMPKG